MISFLIITFSVTLSVVLCGNCCQNKQQATKRKEHWHVEDVEKYAKEHSVGLCVWTHSSPGGFSQNVYLIEPHTTEPYYDWFETSGIRCSPQKHIRYYVNSNKMKSYFTKEENDIFLHMMSEDDIIDDKL